jgi:aryl-alcohol dehydrogenase-like predicted oxidoreductase
MQTTALGHTNVTISRICLGTMTWGVQNTEADAHAQMSYALTQGVNFWDTAEM